MFCPPNIGTDKKIMIGAIVGLVLCAGILTLVGRHYLAVTGVKQTADRESAPQRAVDLSKLSADYQVKSTQIISDFLAAAGSGNADIAQLAASARDNMLALNLPAQFKDKHLAEVLLLGEIGDLAAKGQDAKVPAKLKELSDLAK